MIKINNMVDLSKYSEKLPLVVLADIHNRIGDWMASGGKETDDYIKNQFRYAERVLNSNMV